MAFVFLSACIGCGNGNNTYRTYSPSIPSPTASVSNWSEINISASKGGISNNAGNSQNPTIATDSRGDVYISWSDKSSGNNEIYIKKWNQTIGWVELGQYSASSGGLSNNSGESLRPTIGIDKKNGIVYVAWEDNSNGTEEIYIKQWDGTYWTEVGTASANGSGISNTFDGISSYPSLAVDSLGNVIVAWRELTWNEIDKYTYDDIYVKKWNRTSRRWEEIGLSSASNRGISNTAYSRAPSLAIDSANNPIVSWSDYYREIIEKDGGATTPIYHYEIYTKRWDGVNWSEMGQNSASMNGISPATGEADFPSIAISSNNIPYIAWHDKNTITGNYEIYLKMWNNVGWVDVGTNSASYGGLSNDSGKSLFPILAADKRGSIYVVWSDDTSSNAEIYIKKWAGSNWSDVGANSTSGGGISGTLGNSYTPVIAIDENNIIYVAWSDTTSGNAEIYVKKYW